MMFDDPPFSLTGQGAGRLNPIQWPKLTFSNASPFKPRPLPSSYSHPFYNARSLIENAKREALKAQMQISQLTSDPHHAEAFSDLDREPPKAFHGIKFKYPIPHELTFAIRTALHDLRAALDHVGYVCAAREQSDPKATHFPFAATKAYFEDAIQSRATGRYKHIPAAILDLMFSYRAYGDEDGNRLLYALNDMRNINDHRLLQWVGRALTGVSGEAFLPTERTAALLAQFGGGVIAGRDVLTLMPRLLWPQRYDPDANEILLFWTDARVHPEMDLKFTAYIGFGEVGLLTGQPPITVIGQLCPMVEQIVARVWRKAVETKLFDE